jgi:hypothetical protein
MLVVNITFTTNVGWGSALSGIDQGVTLLHRH